MDPPSNAEENKHKIHEKRKQQLVQRFSRKLGITPDKVSFGKKSTLEIAPGTSIQKMEAFMGLDKIDTQDEKQRKQIQDCKTLLSGNPFEQAIVISDDPQTKHWMKLEAWKLAFAGIHPAELLIKKITMISPNVPEELRKSCHVCKSLTNLQCGGCQSLYYCTRECAKTDRKRHRKECHAKSRQDKDVQEVWGEAS